MPTILFSFLNMCTLFKQIINIETQKCQFLNLKKKKKKKTNKQTKKTQLDENLEVAEYSDWISGI